MAAIPLGAIAFYFIQLDPCFSMNSFNLAKMLEQLSKLPRIRQHNSPMICVSWLANLQQKINWTSSEISVVSSS